MKKLFWLATLAAPILPLFVSCANTKEDEKSRDQINYKSKNITKISEQLEITDVEASINDINFKWSDFIDEFSKLSISSSNYLKDFETLINKNWALFISNLDYFVFKQIPNNKWFLHKENENAKYSDLYKHSIGLIKIENESVPHSHIKFPDKIGGARSFKSFSDVSNKFISAKTGNASVYASLGRVIIQIEKQGEKIHLLPNLLYFVNETGAYDGPINGELWDTVIEVLNITSDGFTETLGVIIDKSTKEIGYPANVYIDKK
ncbi:hypothetical protein [Mycoplasmopsis canis]|uniref:hypothetical protein n=1 Tax=Mycoplasmopsis canis TaxID=29555 RepID=UPI00025AF8B0|nr:hypothetical protein [Mycoplasmopsis canis]EIE40246.1 hypothetical protein MCANUF33_02021 [Mycoplasmopsis canis UF33]EIE41600.1 hypothetical protein MCANUFG1_01961 [Mycoplasmopsis canis UFG1]